LHDERESPAKSFTTKEIEARGETARAQRKEECDDDGGIIALSELRKCLNEQNRAPHSGDHFPERDDTEPTNAFESGANRHGLVV